MAAQDQENMLRIDSGNGSKKFKVEVQKSKGINRKLFAAISAAVAGLIVIVIVIAVVITTKGTSTKGFAGQGQGKSKGKKENLPLIIVSMDGFRADYLTEADAPNLMKLAKSGVRANFIQPQFPTKTFPNHYSIVTGLFPIHHGIVSNRFYDSKLKASFSIGGRDPLDPKWWHGEPMWQTVMKQGLVAGAYFWVGSEVKIDGILPNFTYSYNKSVPFEHRVDTVLSWLDLPREGDHVGADTDNGKRRPDFITLYFYQPDGAGHKFGPGTPEVRNETRYVDSMIGRLYDGLKARSLEDKVNLIMTSDHGMASTSCGRVIYLDELGVTLNDYFTPHYGGGAFMTITPNPRAARSRYISTKIQPCQRTKLRVYTKEQLPKRLHYSHSSRVGDIVVIPVQEYLVGTNISLASLCTPGGNHGYDNIEPSMRAAFLAHGPAFKKGFVMEHFSNTELYNLMAELIGVKPAPNDGTPGSLVHMLATPPDDVVVPRPQGDGNLFREDMCRYPGDQVAKERRECSNCVCSWCRVKQEDRPQYDKMFDLSDEEISSLKKRHFPWGLPKGGAGAGGCLLIQKEYLTGYSTYLRVPLWVGYRLDGETSSKWLPRKDCFRRDVRLTNAQASNCSHYSRSGFDRGHMVPNADFDFDSYRPTMNTFVLSNIAPQWHKFNVGDWVKLEKYIRVLAKKGTIYVISGSLFDEDADGHRDNDLNVTRWIKNQPNTVAIPTHYYKIILRCDVKKTPYYEVPGCSGRLEVISFILPHNKEYHCSLHSFEEYLLEHSASVKDVERLTGVNFFSDLPPAEQARLKTYSPVKLWD